MKRSWQQLRPTPRADEAVTFTVAEVRHALRGEGLVYYGLGDKQVADDFEKDRARARHRKRRRAAR